MLVQPIRDKEKIEQMKTELKKVSYRNYMIFYTGINSGLRISDILQLKAGQVRSEIIQIKEKKTTKPRTIKLNREVKRMLVKYAEELDDDMFLFRSRQGGNNPISRIQAYRILNDAAEKCGLEHIATHTMRKSFGYWHYKKFGDVAILQEIFNHDSPSDTLKYIGISQDNIDKTFEDFIL